MITVEQAEHIILAQARAYGHEYVALEASTGRVLAAEVTADRDMPPYNRVAMDGIALRYEGIKSGLKTFRSKGVQAAGDAPIDIEHAEECIEIMTGCALPASADTVVRYEDVEVKDGIATLLTDTIRPAQNVHRQGKDKRRGDVVAAAGQVVTPALVNVLASVGATEVLVKKLPRVVVISTGNELVDVHQTPTPVQIRQSNNYALRAALKTYRIESDLLHLPDDLSRTKQQLEQCLSNYDVLVLSGGVSAGRFDYLPQAMEEAGVQRLFHKVQQKPGKPFWFGSARNGALVFALPGNPVSAFLCGHRYLLPWLRASLGIANPTFRAALAEDFTGTAHLRYFLQVKLQWSDGAQLLAVPLAGNGSGDLAHLSQADAFMELPEERTECKKGEVYRIWPFKDLL